MRNTRLSPVVLVIALLAAVGCGGGSSAPVSAARGDLLPGDWPQWRGPDRTGVSPDTGLLAKWPTGGPPLLWKATNIGSGYATVAIADGRVFTLGDRDDAEFIVALDESNGQEIWSHRIGDEYDNSKGGGPRSTPTVVGDLLYTLSAHGDLWCLSTDDGTPRWHVNILEKFGTENIKWGLSESPLVDGKLVVVITGSPEGSIVAFDRDSGEIVWQSAGVTDEPGYASAIVATVGSVRQIIHFTDEATVGIRASDGELLWRYETASNSTANCATPLFHEDQVFVTSGYDTGAALLQLTSNDSGTTAEEVYFTRDMMNHHGGVVLVDGYVYGFSGSNLTCLDLKTGEQKWRHRSVGKGSITAADGMLYLVSEKNKVGLVRATPEGYQEISRFSTESKSSKSWAHPVVSGKRLYIRNRDDLLCYDIAAKG